MAKCNLGGNIKEHVLFTDAICKLSRYNEMQCIVNQAHSYMAGGCPMHLLAHTKYCYS